MIDHQTTVVHLPGSGDINVRRRVAQVYAYILEIARVSNSDEEENRSKESTLDATPGTGETTGTLQQKPSGDSNPRREASPEAHSPHQTLGAHQGEYHE